MGKNQTCGTKIRPLRDGTELECADRRGPGHDGTCAAVLRDRAYPGSETRIEWLAGDRRVFRGVWVPCPYGRCVLPIDHRGDHAP